MPVRPAFADRFDTSPLVAPARVQILGGGTWTHDAAGGSLRQDDTASSSRWLTWTSCPWRRDVLDYSFTATILTDPAGLRHIGAFLQAIPGEATGLRVAYQGNVWNYAFYLNGNLGNGSVGSFMDVTVVAPGGATTQLAVGVPYRIRVRWDLRSGLMQLWVNGVEQIRSDRFDLRDFVKARPGVFTYGCSVRFDDVEETPVPLRLRQDFLKGLLAQPLGAGGVLLQAPELAALLPVASPDILALVLDPDSAAPEIVHVTAHGAGAQSATVLRGREGTAARDHPGGTRFVHAPTAADYPSLIP